MPGTEIFYSIQGNILRPGEVVPNAVKAFLAAKGAITDRVMAAMEAADASRRRQPLLVPAAARRRRRRRRFRATARPRTSPTS